MFKRGISEAFAEALIALPHWQQVIEDKDFFLAMRGKSINVYYQGCSIFKISYEKNRIRTATHYKYLINPDMKDPYIVWEGTSTAIKSRSEEVFIDNLNLKSLKKAASYYAGAEKKGVHNILRSNGNIVDVEIALSREAKDDQETEDQAEASTSVADRIDFAALQQVNGVIRLVFFEAKRFDNPELRSAKNIEPPVLKQVWRYEKIISDNLDSDGQQGIEGSYVRVCKNLRQLAPERCDPLTAAVADGAELTVDPNVRLVVFGYDTDQRDGKVWGEHEKKLREKLGKKLLSKGNPSGFTNGIGKYAPETPA